MKSTPSSRIFWLKTLNSDQHINGTDFRVAFAIANHVNNVTGFAFPAAELLAKQVHLSAKTVRRSLHTLLRYGYLKVGPRMYRSVTYILTLNHRAVPIDVQASDKSGRLGTQNVASASDKSDHQTYSKPTYKTYGERSPPNINGASDDDTLEANIKKLCSSFLGRRDRLFDSPHRQRYEPELRERLGEEAGVILAVLPEQCTEQLLQHARRGSLMTKDVLLARRLAKQIQESDEG
jgi:hypothetical protein